MISTSYSVSIKPLSLDYSGPSEEIKQSGYQSTVPKEGIKHLHRDCYLPVSRPTPTIELLKHNKGDPTLISSKKTISGTKLHQPWESGDLLKGNVDECVNDSQKLRPLNCSKDKFKEKKSRRLSLIEQTFE